MSELVKIGYFNDITLMAMNLGGRYQSHMSMEDF